LFPTLAKRLLERGTNTSDSLDNGLNKLLAIGRQGVLGTAA